MTFGEVRMCCVGKFVGGCARGLIVTQITIILSLGISGLFQSINSNAETQKPTA